MKNKLLILIFVFLLLITSCSIKKEKYILLIGNNTNLKENLERYNLDYKINDSYNYSNMDSKELLKILKSNPISNKDEKRKLNELIKESKYIFINIGIVDLLKKISISTYEKKIFYDDDNLEQMFELMINNISLIIDYFKNLCQGKIILQGYDNFFTFLDIKDQSRYLIELLNINLLNICKNKKIEFLNIALNNSKYYDSEFSFLLNSDGKKKLAEIINEKIIANNW